MRVIKGSYTPPDAVVMCVLASDHSPYDDNKRALCMFCGRVVQFRPYIPDANKKVCIPCAYAHRDDVDEMVVTEHALREVEEYFKTQW